MRRSPWPIQLVGYVRTAVCSLVMGTEPETNSVIPVWVEAVTLVNRELLPPRSLPNGVVFPALDGQAGALLGAGPWVVGPTRVGPSPQFAPGGTHHLHPGFAC